MYTIEEEKVHVIPVDFNVFFNNAKEYKNKIRYSPECIISESFFSELCQYIIACKEDEIVAIDMKGVASYPTRLFSKLEKNLSKIVFFNVERDKVQRQLTEDLDNLDWIDDTVGFYSEKTDWEIKTLLESYCANARRKEIKRIVNQISLNENGRIQYLDSSGLYSNCYVDIKKLFINVNDYYYILFCLAEKVSMQIQKRQIDAFISSSKNGAIIANILGGMLDIKEIHLLGVGPIYSMELGDSLESIKKGKKYAYIFDFMCTGTELKIASALVNSKRAYLDYAAGIAKYKRKEESTNIDTIEVLFYTNEMEKEFRLVGDAKDLMQGGSINERVQEAALYRENE